MKRIAFILGFLLIGCLGVMAQRSAENMSAYGCASYGRKLFNMGLYEDAWPYVQKAAEAGYEDAHLMAGWMFCNGKGVKQDYKVAMREYNNGAMKGNAICFNNMGYMYENGLGVRKNPQVAFNLYKKAADKRELYGYKNMARCYEYGIGVAVDLDKALEYYNYVRKNTRDDNVANDCGKSSTRVNHKIDKRNLDAALQKTQMESKDFDFDDDLICWNTVRVGSDSYLPDFGLECKYATLAFSSYDKTTEWLLLVFNRTSMGGEELSLVKTFYDKYRIAKIYDKNDDTCIHTGSPFLKLVEITDEWRDRIEERPWVLMRGTPWGDYWLGRKEKKWREFFGIGGYYDYSKGENDPQWIDDWADNTVVLMDKSRKIVWRGHLFDKDSLGNKVVNPVIVELWDAKHNECKNALIAKAVQEYDFSESSNYINPLYISKFEEGQYEMKFYKELKCYINRLSVESYTQMLEIPFEKEDFTEEQLNQMRAKAYEQFKSTAPLVNRISLQNMEMDYSGKQMVYNPETDSWISTQTGEKPDEKEGEIDIAKRYGSSSIIKNRLYFLGRPKVRWYSPNLQGDDEEKDIITVRMRPTKEICREYLRKYPQGKYNDMVLEMYQYHITKIKDKEKKLRKE